MRRTNSTVDLETLQNQQQLSELEKMERNIKIEDRKKIGKKNEEIYECLF